MNLGNVAKIDALMSTERDCAWREDGASFRYLLCSTARCGSNLISDALQQTGLAGDPMEYLNPRYMAGYIRSQNQAQTTNADSKKIGIRRYLRALEQRRSSANGYFGVKVHFEHLTRMYKQLDSAKPLLQNFDRIVMLRRRDKIAQAVSLHKARVTQIWSSQDRQYLDPKDPRLTRQAEFDPVAIARALFDLVAQENGWERLLRRLELPFETFWYEDWVANRDAESLRLMQALDLADHVSEVKAPTLARQGQDNDPMVAEFRQALGLKIE